jgi:hypothetical protein
MLFTKDINALFLFRKLLCGGHLGKWTKSKKHNYIRGPLKGLFLKFTSHFIQSSGFQFFNQFDAMVTILDVGLEMKIKYKNLTDDKTTHTK